MLGVNTSVLENIAKSTDAPGCAKPLASGGYTVKTIPAFISTIFLDNKRVPVSAPDKFENAKTAFDLVNK